MDASCRSAAELVIQAPAKLNLFFEVLAKRSDGYHEIESLMCPIDLYDTLHFQDAQRAGSFGVSTGDSAPGGSGRSRTSKCSGRGRKILSCGRSSWCGGGPAFVAAPTCCW